MLEFPAFTHCPLQFPETESGREGSKKKERERIRQWNSVVGKSVNRTQRERAR